MKKIIPAIALVIIVGAAAWYFWPNPGTTTTEDGVIWKNASEDIIQLDLVRPGVTVLPRFTVTGQARGSWYFEGSFPVEVLDADGNQLAIAPAQAEGNWQTEDFVRFSVVLNVGEYSGPATLVLFKDNPSGLAENDASVSVPIEVFDVN
jgi:hypothetical protein